MKILKNFDDLNLKKNWGQNFSKFRIMLAGKEIVVKASVLYCKMLSNERRKIKFFDFAKFKKSSFSEKESNFEIWQNYSNRLLKQEKTGMYLLKIHHHCSSSYQVKNHQN